MKISKEKHKAMSVTLKKEEKQQNNADKTEGQILPLKKDQKLEQYIQDRVKDVRRLYKVLGPSAVSKTGQREQDVIDCFNGFMRDIISKKMNIKPPVKKNTSTVALTPEEKIKRKKMEEKRVRDIAEYVKKNAAFIEVKEPKEAKKQEKKAKGRENSKPVWKPLQDIFIDIDKEHIHKLVSLHLRGSLKKHINIEKGGQQMEVYIPDVIEKLVFAVTHGTQIDSVLEEIGEEELVACFHVIFKDYTKEDEVQKIARSIENQDVKVQVCGFGETARLQLASADHKKKKYIFLFLKKFACVASEKERDNLLREFRELLVLFYCGTAAYEEVKERKSGIPVWSFDFLSKMVSDVPNVFSQECSEKLMERDQLKEETDKDKRRQNKSKIKDIDIEVKGILTNLIAERYREGKKVLKGSLEENYKEEYTEKYEEKCFWLECIERDAEGLLLCTKKNMKKALIGKKLNTIWLCENSWKNFLSFLCMKAVDMGKAVYHFAMPDLEQLESGEPVKAGMVKPQFQKGITSFDYERIKAEESLDRNFMTAISFALNNFSSTVCPPEVYEKEKNEDILSMEGQVLKKEMYPNVSWRMMQYFGGASQWENSRFENLSALKEEKELNETFVFEVRNAMRVIRNSAFHYAASIAQGTLDKNSYLVEIFEKEQKNLGSKYRKKYASNNVPMFYRVEDINRLMKYLYKDQIVLESQIPLFRNVINRKSLPEVREQIIKKKAYTLMTDSTTQTEKFNSALYFILKEIYYNGFLQEKNLYKRFRKSFYDELNEVQQSKSKEDFKKKKAMEDFEKRAKALKRKNGRLTLGELCQAIMTDYNLQNNQKKVRLNKKDNLPEEKYKHYRELPAVCLKRAFIDYIKEDVEGDRFGCAFLKEPRVKENIYENITEEQFCKGWRVDKYKSLIKADGIYDSWLISWFIVAHFMTPKHLNHLRGEIKSYLSYVHNIERRRWEAMGVQIAENEEKKEKYRQVLEILNLAAEYCGQVSNESTDYYESEEEYAKHISKFVAFEEEYSERPLEEQLYIFCNQRAEDSPAERIGIFYDGENPILNRNVVLAKMYGTETLLAECLQEDRVTKEDIEEHYKQAKSLTEVFKYGKCKNKEQEKARRLYQQQKNRIELVNVLRYSDLLNDFMSQLISWCYLRERDRMYFQMGLHYIRLYYEDTIVEKGSKFRILQSKEARAGERKGINLLDGALLYQLAAVYTYEYPVYTLDKEGNAVFSKKAKPGSMTTLGVTAFWKEYCNGDASIYEQGLFLFENPVEEREVFGFRNYIDHFKYYSRRDRSILELYSQVFANYFRYDNKLRKSVTFIFKNILARHFVIARTVLEETKVEKIDDRKDRKNPIIRNYNQAVFRIPEDNGLQSDDTLHKYTEEDVNNAIKAKKNSKDRNGGKKYIPRKDDKYKIPMYDENFIKCLYRILNYAK